MKNHFLTVNDFSEETILKVLSTAEKLKKMPAGTFQPLKGKSLGLFFEKSSTRTRISFEIGMGQLGGNVIFLHPNDIQINRGETIGDTARVFARYLDAIVIRTFKHDNLVEWASYSDIPVINGLTDAHHPCQGLTDVFTVRESIGSFSGVKVAYIGDSNNVLVSLLHTAAKVGLNLTICFPEGYGPGSKVLNEAKLSAVESGAVIDVCQIPQDAVKGADFIYTDVWTSMGQEDESAERTRRFQGFQVNSDLLALAKPSVKVMHCLPAMRGKEITSDVLDGEHSIVFDQAENKLHVQKAIILELIGQRND